VVYFVDIFFRNWFVKAGPTRAGIEFGGRIKQFVTAGNTSVHARLLRVVILSREGRLRGFHAAYLILLWREFALPFFFGLFNFVLHNCHCTSGHAVRWSTSSRWTVCNSLALGMHREGRRFRHAL